MGPIGVHGVDGVAGTTGIHGMEGVAGPIGVQGVNGIDGPMGVQGVDGVMGSTGIQGVEGVIGVMGVHGAEGVIGPIGVHGIEGVIGPIGVHGVEGVTGADGVTGAGGVTGAEGTEGARGFQGIPELGDGAMGGLRRSLYIIMRMTTERITTITYTMVSIFKYFYFSCNSGKRRLLGIDDLIMTNTTSNNMRVHRRCANHVFKIKRIKKIQVKRLVPITLNLLINVEMGNVNRSMLKRSI